MSPRQSWGRIMADNPRATELVQGTLDLLILRTLGGGPMHGYAIARRIQQASQDVLQVEEGSLYPALHRMERRGWIEGQWGLSETKRKAKYYRLTASGRVEAESQAAAWRRLTTAMANVIGIPAAES